MEKYYFIFLAQTDYAILVDDAGYKIWLPKSQITCSEEYELLIGGDEIEVNIPDWLAEDKGIF